VVVFVLVGVRHSEVGYRVAELGRLAEVCRDRNPVTGTGMRAGKCPATELAV